METSCRGTFVISWSQTQTDGETAAKPTALAAGKTWRWDGEVVRIDGPGALLRLDRANGEAELRRKAAERVRKLIGAARSNARDLSSIDLSEVDPAIGLGDECFLVTDGREAFIVTVIAEEGARPLAMFVDQLPPRGRDLWVVEARIAPRGGALVHGNELGRMICFTPGTKIQTADGGQDVALLRQGDLVQTKDNGLQPVLWTGARRVTGARLQVMPDLAPVRILAGALGSDIPDDELLVSPEHRMLVKGARARALFNTDEVLVNARDLVDGRHIWIDRMVREVRYVHVLFERHEIVFANGLETESFHPAQAALTGAQLTEIEACLPEASTHVFARRVLSSPEAAILAHAA
ncbi:MAG: Hint domain-containing protein [Pseudomonadota bacterium]